MNWLRHLLDSDASVILNVILTVISIFELAKKARDKMKSIGWKVVAYLVLTIVFPIWLLITSGRYSGVLYYSLQVFSWMTLCGVIITAGIFLYLHLSLPSDVNKGK